MDKQLNILISTSSIFDTEPENTRQMAAIAPGAEIRQAERNKVTSEMLEWAEIMMGWPDSAKLSSAKKLRWLHLPSAGADRYADRKLYYNQDIILTNSSGVFGKPIAEHVFSLIMAFNRKLPYYFSNQLKRQWKRVNETADFFDSTVGIIGLGDIGTEVALRAHAWGAKVLAVKRSPGQKPAYVDEIYGEEGIDRLLEQSDYVILCLPSTSKTRGIISEERLKKMKRNAFIVNIGRGELIDQEALVKALRERWIAGAGLDVTTPEPLAENSPLWEMPNVIITPHTSGNSPTNTKRRMNIFLRNLQLYVEGKRLENLVDFEQGY